MLTVWTQDLRDAGNAAEAHCTDRFLTRQDNNAESPEEFMYVAFGGTVEK